jgi:hypothetical protein
MISAPPLILSHTSVANFCCFFVSQLIRYTKSCTVFEKFIFADNMVSLCRLYADDNSLQQCSDNISLIEQKLNNDLVVKKNGY